MSAPAVTGDVWSTLVGQRPVVEVLRAAVSGAGMTHAWLFTGPPGSGRSNAALAFAAALQCPQGGCGRCHACRTVLAGSHPDVSLTRSETAVLYIDDMRDLVHRAALAPVERRWQVMLVEDADRLGDRTGNTLLKAIEEPTAKTVWLLCAPTLEDVLPTIRSRARNVALSTPGPEDVARFLVEREAVPEALAAYAARASQGHIGRARALARDEATRNRRREVVSIPVGLTSLGSCVTAAANLLDIAKDETAAITAADNETETRRLSATYGEDRKATSSRSYRAALRELAHLQKQRERRRVMDVVDRCLMDIASVYRDVVAVQLGARSHLVNEELREDVTTLARRTSPEHNLRRIDAIFTAREHMLEFNANREVTLEAMMTALRI